LAAKELQREGEMCGLGWFDMQFLSFKITQAADKWLVASGGGRGDTGAILAWDYGVGAW
jgi:hypothetical protein